MLHRFVSDVVDVGGVHGDGSEVGDVGGSAGADAAQGGDVRVDVVTE